MHICKGVYSDKLQHFRFFFLFFTVLPYCFSVVIISTKMLKWLLISPVALTCLVCGIVHNQNVIQEHERQPLIFPCCHLSLPSSMFKTFDFELPSFALYISQINTLCMMLGLCIWDHS